MAPGETMDGTANGETAGSLRLDESLISCSGLSSLKIMVKANTNEHQSSSDEEENQNADELHLHCWLLSPPLGDSSKKTRFSMLIIANDASV